MYCSWHINYWEFYLYLSCNPLLNIWWDIEGPDLPVLPQLIVTVSKMHLCICIDGIKRIFWKQLWSCIEIGIYITSYLYISAIFIISIAWQGILICCTCYDGMDPCLSLFYPHHGKSFTTTRLKSQASGEPWLIEEGRKFEHSSLGYFLIVWDALFKGVSLRRFQFWF